MEIKVGDKVRVRKDAPKIYTHEEDVDWFNSESIVTVIDGDAAEIKFVDDEDEWGYIAIPTKYLIKVDAEAKDANVKIGDKVVVHYPNGDRIGRIQEEMLDGTYDIDYGDGCTGHNITRSQIEPYTAPKYKVGNWVMISGVFNPQLNGMIGWISRIDKDGNKVSFQDGRFAIVEDKYLTLITQPTEQTEQKKSNVGFIKIPVEVDLTDGYWDAYTAELAKEVALRVANKYNGPKEAAEYAVKVAKAVVEGLKRK